MRARCLVALVAAASLQAVPCAARTLEVGPGRQYARPSDAVAAAQDGDVVRIAPGEYSDCAMVARSRVVLQDAGPGTVLTGRVCGDKALLVIPGNDVVVRDLTLAGARAPAGNGAGIRMEGVNLTVERVRFVDNQSGILTVANAQSTLLVRESTFARNGGCDANGGNCAHTLYAGALGLLRVERSVFRETRQGHHIKSRALRTEVVGCDVADGPAGTASYLVDVPNGGNLLLRDNQLAKGPNAENKAAAVVIGAEGVNRPTPEVRIEDNRFSREGSYPTTFVVNRTATEAELRGNRLIGGGIRPLQGAGTVDGH